MTAAGWCGRRPVTTPPRWAASSTCSARSGVRRSGWSARTRPSGSRGSWPLAVPRRGCAWTRSTWPEWARVALWKNPEDLTGRQRAKLAWIAQVNDRLYRAWLLKEELRLVFKLKGVRATVLLEAWLGWARRCRIPAFVRLARSISQHRAGIQAALTEGLSNGLVESVNTKIRLLTRVAFGFRSPEALIALAMLSLGGLCTPLPGRA